MFRTVLAFWLILASPCRGESLLPLVEPERFIGDRLAGSLTGSQGSADRGREVFVSRDAGHCVLCHSVRSLDVPFQGTVGPDLSAVGGRLSRDQIRLRIVDFSRINPDTLMPPYYRIAGLRQVAPQYDGQPVLTAVQVEDLVAYLATLTDE